MTIEEFRNRVKEEIISLKGEKFRIQDSDVLKNNGIVLHGITVIRKNRNISPTIYLEGFYRKYETGVSIDYIVERILEEEDKAKLNCDFDGEFFLSYENIRERIYVKMINTEKNEKLLMEVPNREFMDLSMVVYCDVSDMCHMDASILIRNQHLKSWDTDEEELINTAYENTRNRGVYIKDMGSIFDRMDVCEMFVMSNKNMQMGAVCMTFDDKLDELCERTGGGVYIIPSSIHEIILIPEKYVLNHKTYLNDMISEVNREHLSEEEILSDHAYFYCASQGYITV